MFSRPKILFLVSLLFVALLNPKFNPYLLFKFLIFYHSSVYSIRLQKHTDILTVYKEYGMIMEEPLVNKTDIS